MNKTLSTKLDGTYTKLLRYALNIKWTDRITNKEVYGSLKPVSIRLMERRLIFIGHCWRSNESAKQFVSDLLFWKSQQKGKTGNRSNFIKIFLENIGLPNDKSNLTASIERAKDLLADRKKWKDTVKKLIEKK
jgi:hypothetical protein